MKKTILMTLACVVLMSGVARAAEWYEKIKLGGDFRHRYETIRDDSKDADRHRWRIRARLMLTAAVNDEVKIGLRLATGSDDPVSTNQTLSGAFSTKGYHLDLAYLEYSPKAVDGFHFIGGKMKLPFARPQKTQLIFDGDLSPEGMAVKFGHSPGENFAFFINGAALSVIENSGGDDIWLFGGQAGIEVEPSETAHMMLGGSWYGYENIKGAGALYDGDFFGNSHEDDAFVTGYRLFEVLGEVGFKMDRVSIVAYGDYVTNTDADSLNTGWLFGAAISHGKGRGGIKVFGNYRKLERDAVVGTYADSDFAGGGTDGEGVKAGLSYGLLEKVDVAATLFVNKKGIEDEVDYTRLQVDLKMKF